MDKWSVSQISLFLLFLTQNSYRRTPCSQARIIFAPRRACLGTGSASPNEPSPSTHSFSHLSTVSSRSLRTTHGLGSINSRAVMQRDSLQPLSTESCLSSSTARTRRKTTSKTLLGQPPGTTSWDSLRGRCLLLIPILRPMKRLHLTRIRSSFHVEKEDASIEGLEGYRAIEKPPHSPVHRTWSSDGNAV